METLQKEYESVYYFIKYDGNENNIKHLKQQLDEIEWYIMDGLSTFDLYIDHFISEKSAKEFTKLDLNHSSFHRKFDGVLDKIDFEFGDCNDDNILIVNDILGRGDIEDYIDNEDIDDEDLLGSDEPSRSDSSSEYSELTDDNTDNIEYKNIPKSVWH